MSGLRIGDRVGRYEITGLVGSGGMGSVHRARDTALGRTVALKILPDDLAADPSFRRRFDDESRLTASLDHPHVVPIHEAGEADGRLFIAMRLVEGHDLGRLIASNGALEPASVVELLRGVALALDAAHAKGLVHRDVKPGNILVEQVGDGVHAWLVDFGLARERGGDRGLTTGGQFVGSVDYAAPEQIRGHPVEPAADVYALSCVAFECLTGHPPYERSVEIATLFGHLHEPPPAVSSARPELQPLDDVVARGLAKSPADRPPSASAFVRALAAAVDALRAVGAGHAGSSGSEASSAPGGGVAGVDILGVPAQTTTFVGRDSALADVASALGTARLVTLTGPGGVGKTRLAARAALASAPAFPGGVRFVELAAVPDGSLVLPAIAESLGVRAADAAALEAAVASRLAGAPLLVLDNIEHVVSAGVLVSRLLTAAPSLRVLATGRRAFHILGEHELPVPPLSMPDPAASPDELVEAPAVRLFLDRARAIRPDLVVGPDEARQVAEICARLDGLPLAIELAAARVRLLSPAAILRRLSTRLALLGGGPVDAADRHRTLRAAIAWSADLLSDAERGLFRRLAIFSGGWTAEAAEAVAGDGRRDEGAGGVLEHLEQLVDHHLVLVRFDQDGESRFDYLETIREFAREELEASGELAATAEAHARHVLAFAEVADEGLRGPEQAAWTERLAEEHNNVRAALRWAVHGGDPELAARLGVAMWWFWDLRGHLPEAREWLERIARLPLGDEMRAQALNGLGCIADSQRDADAALAALHGALDLHRAAGDERRQGIVLTNIGVVARDQGRDEEAELAWAEALAVFDRLGDRVSIAAVRSNLGLLARDRGDVEEAIRQYEGSLAVDRELHDQRGEAIDLNNLGFAELHLGRLDRARELLGASLRLKARLGARPGMAESLEGLAHVAGRWGEAVRAARWYGAAAALRADVGVPASEVDLGPYLRYVEEARARADPAAFDAAWADGLALADEAAVEEAIRWAEAGIIDR